MIRGLPEASSWFDCLEKTTLWHVGPPERRWSWFQVTWAGLHAAAVLMHAISVIYHARRAKLTGRPGNTVRLPAPHAELPAAISVVDRRAETDRLRRAS